MADVPTPDPRRYDEVRKKLLERGYLNGRIERFLLQDLLRAASPAKQIAGTALKAAFLGGPILGALLAGAAVVANRPMLGGSDAAVLWLYFTVLSGAALWVLDVAAAALVSRLARRRGARAGDSWRAAFLVGVPTLAYVLVLWWERGRGGGTAGEVLFLAAAVVATLLVAWLAGIVSLAGVVGRTGEVPDRNRRGAVAVTVALALVAAAFLVLPEAASGAAAPEPPSPFAPAPRDGTLTFVGIDGLDGSMVEAFSGRGAVDGLLAAMARGAVVPKRHAAGAEPPEVWTTILTGAPASEHGVTSVGAERLPGVATPLRGRGGPAPLEAALRFLLPARTVPASGVGRRVRTLWEIVALSEPSASVGWWASWPARDGGGPPAPGYVVSDRVLAKLLSGGREDRDTSPASLYDRLRNDFDADRAAIRAEFEARFRLRAGSEISAVAWQSFVIDAYAWRVALRLAADPALRGSFVYLPGLDILRTRLAARPGASAPGGMVEAQEALEAYVGWLDARVAEAAAPAAGRRLVVVADPGRAAARDAEGFVLVLHPRAKAGCVGAPVDDVDVAPLVLDLLGYPASREMAGREPRGCLEPAATAVPPIATYGRRGRPTGETRSDFDPEMLERLKSLGYLR